MCEHAYYTRQTVVKSALVRLQRFAMLMAARSFVLSRIEHDLSRKSFLVVDYNRKK